MSKIVVIHQPDFLPYLGFFHRFLHADTWVVLDHVQFLSGSKSWHNRDKIKTAQGEKWLTIAVCKCPQKTPINEVMLSDTPWRVDHLNLITTNYRTAPFFSEIMPYLSRLYENRCERLIDFNMASIAMLMQFFDVEVPIVLASSLQPEGKANDLLVDLLIKTQADGYLSGVGAKTYFDPSPFDEAKLSVVWQNFTHPVYPQLHGDFMPYLSSIDLLFNCGIERSREILRGR